MTIFEDIFWRPSEIVRSPIKLNSVDAGRLQNKDVVKYVELEPEPGCICYVVELPNGKVIGDARLVSTSKNAVIGDLQFLYGAADQENHWIVKQRLLRMPRNFGGRGGLVMLAASNAENYYHWLFDSLPRLQLLKNVGYDLKDIDGYLLDKSKRSFQIESLALMGIHESKLFRCSKWVVARCERLILPSMPGPLGYPPRWICNYLREQFKPGQQQRPHRKIYISRGMARGRKIVNEIDILPQLTSRGYEVHRTENMTFTQQVELFSSAKEIISAHGAGLSNIVFAQPGAKVLELGSRLHNNLSFRTIAINSDLQYEHMFLDSAPGPDGVETRFANIVANQEEFRLKLGEFSQ